MTRPGRLRRPDWLTRGSAAILSSAAVWTEASNGDKAHPRSLTGRVWRHGGGRDPPFLFQKPSDSVVPNRSTLKFPRMTTNLHHEIELVSVTGKVPTGAAILAPD
jgi:2-keto-4-pentenoate hydratase/2-oxohepta-3-ene-1,7-dioic acid hydratase in catechol pathway